MDNGIELAHEVSKKLALLASRYRNLKDEVEMLKAENRRLTEEKDDIENDYKELKEKFDIYKMSMTMSHNTKDVRQTRLYINQMMREIDKCISLLNH